MNKKEINHAHKVIEELAQENEQLYKGMQKLVANHDVLLEEEKKRHERTKKMLAMTEEFLQITSEIKVMPPYVQKLNMVCEHASSALAHLEQEKMKAQEETNEEENENEQDKEPAVEREHEGEIPMHMALGIAKMAKMFGVSQESFQKAIDSAKGEAGQPLFAVVCNDCNTIVLFNDTNVSKKCKCGIEIEYGKENE